MPGAPTSGLGRLVSVYTLLVAVAVGLYFVIRSIGLDLAPPSAPASEPTVGAAGGAHALLHVLLALVVIISLARLLGAAFRWLHQPPVIGEMVAGIILGPSLLGRIAPEASAFVLPTSVAPFLGVMSQVGVILYMFLVGLELDIGILRRRGHATVAISHASIVVPFLLGALLALYLFPRLAPGGVGFTSFSLFLGVSMSVTAFPVLARILTDRKMQRTRMGTIALTCAAVDDVTAWCLLALVVGVVKSQAESALLTTLFAGGYIGLIIFAARPLMRRLALLYGAHAGRSRGVLAMVLVVLLLSSLATEAIGIHAVFGAFLLGAVIPHESTLARDLVDRLEDLVVVLFLPAFFAFTGLRTQLGLVTGTSDWLLCGAIILVATVGKFGGSFVAARATGLPTREAAVLGILMNTRGLMELIVLNIGLELGVISPELFAMLVVMAIVTTVATTPLVHLFGPEPDREEVRPRATTERPRAGVLVPLANPDGMAPLIDLALAATRPDEPPPRALTLVRRSSEGVRTSLLAEERPPRADVLVQALSHVQARGARLDAEARWTDDEAADILGAAERAHVAWILLGFHRPMFGHDSRGGVVRDVLERASESAAHVAIVLHRHDRPLETLFAVVDDSAHGRAALDLGLRFAQHSGSVLHVVLVPREGTEPEPPLAALIRDAARDAGRWLHTDVLTRQTQLELAGKTAGDLVIIGESLADRLGLPLDPDRRDDKRCIVIVR